MLTLPFQIRLLKKILLKSLTRLETPPALKVWEWAELRRRLTKKVTARPGLYRVATAPYQREPQEAFTDPAVQTTVLYWAKRLGKTEMLNNLHGSKIEQDPSNILVVYPTLDSAKKWSKQFFEPMRKSIAILRELIRDARSRDSNNTILSKEFPGGAITAIGANSPSGFRQVQAPTVTCDEIDAMDNGPEGDPITLAFGRAENYSDSIQVVSSTATRIVTDAEEGNTGSRIHDWWLKSDRRKWFCKGPCCGNWHVLAWENVKWPEPHKHEEAWYQCPDCGDRWDDTKRLKSILAGEWRATAAFKGIRGYWLNGLNTTFPAKKGYKSKLHQFAAEFYEAYTSGQASRVSWKNTFLCEPHLDAAERVDHSGLIARLEDYTRQTLPENVLVITAQADIQVNRIEVEIDGHGVDDESWGIERRVLRGDLERKEIWQELADFLRGNFRRVDGVEMGLDCAAIDVGYRPKSVRKFIKTCGLPRIYAVAGSTTDQSLLVRPRFDKHSQMWTYMVATDSAKDSIFARLKLESHGPGYMHYCKGGYFDDDYFRQLTAEAVRIEYRKGFPRRIYVKIRDRNEALDLRVYGLAALEILKPRMPEIAKALKAKASPATEATNPEPEPSKPPPARKPLPFRRPMRSPGGFVNSWR